MAKLTRPQDFIGLTPSGSTPQDSVPARYNHESCKCFEVNRVDVFLDGFLLNVIYRHEPFDFHERADSSRWELFSNPPRLHSPLQNEQTLRFLRSLPEDKWTNNPRHWHLKTTTLHDHPRLNRLEPESTMNSPLEKDEGLTHLHHQLRDTRQSSPPSSNQWCFEHFRGLDLGAQPNLQTHPLP